MKTVQTERLLVFYTVNLTTIDNDDGDFRMDVGVYIHSSKNKSSIDNKLWPTKLKHWCHTKPTPISTEE